MRGRTTEAAQAVLDVMLTDAAVGGPSRLPRPGVAARLGAGLARHPDRALRRAGGLGSELVCGATGRSKVRPAKRNRRFSAPAWESSWLFRRLLQTHLAVSGTVDGLISDAESSPPPKRLGGRGYKALAKRPGNYVHAS